MVSVPRSVTVLLVILVLVAPLAGAATATVADDLPFDSRWLGERVLVLTERSPWESNHVVIVTSRGLVLVDPGHTPLMGRLIRQAASAVTGRDRFAYVIDTHEHWGHTWGNAAFPESWNVYDSLGEALAVKGETARAIDRYRRSVELNPANANGIAALERLGAGS